MSTRMLRDVLADLPFLVAVADEGGITAAADALGVPQPTVSRAMARLADRTGVQLLERDRRGVAFTPAGRSLVGHARTACEAAQGGVDAARRVHDNEAATARIAFQHTLGRTVVPALVRALLARRPDIRVDLRQGARDFCLHMFHSRAVDAVLVSPPLDSSDPRAADPSVRTLHLYAEPLVLTVAPQHRLAHRRRIRILDLTGERLLVLAAGYGLRMITDDLVRSAGAQCLITFEGEDVQTLRGLVAAGLGVAILPPATQPQVDNIEIPISDPGARREIGVSWRTDKVGTSATAILHSVLEENHDWLPLANQRGLARPG